MRAEIKILAKEERKRQQEAIEEVLLQAPVICATLSGVLSHQMKDLKFDVTVIDEAAQVHGSSYLNLLPKLMPNPRGYLFLTQQSYICGFSVLVSLKNYNSSLLDSCHQKFKIQAKLGFLMNGQNLYNLCLCWV